MLSNPSKPLSAPDNYVCVCRKLSGQPVHTFSTNPYFFSATLHTRVCLETTWESMLNALIANSGHAQPDLRQPHVYHCASDLVLRLYQPETLQGADEMTLYLRLATKLEMSGLPAEADFLVAQTVCRLLPEGDDKDAFSKYVDEHAAHAVTIRVVNPYGMSLMLVPPGLYAEEQPDGVTRIALTRPLFFGSRTVLQQEAYAALNRPEPATIRPWTGTYHEAVQLCRTMSKQESCTYRLPSFAEWTWAVLGGRATRRDTATPFRSHFSSDFWSPKDFWQFPVNPLGIHVFDNAVFELTGSEYNPYREPQSEQLDAEADAVRASVWYRAANGDVPELIDLIKRIKR